MYVPNIPHLNIFLVVVDGIWFSIILKSLYLFYLVNSCQFTNPTTHTTPLIFLSFSHQISSNPTLFSTQSSTINISSPVIPANRDNPSLFIGITVLSPNCRFCSYSYTTTYYYQQAINSSFPPTSQTLP